MRKIEDIIDQLSVARSYNPHFDADCFISSECDFMIDNGLMYVNINKENIASQSFSPYAYMFAHLRKEREKDFKSRLQFVKKLIKLSNVFEENSKKEKDVALSNWFPGIFKKIKTSVGEKDVEQLTPKGYKYMAQVFPEFIDCLKKRLYEGGEDLSIHKNIIKR